MNGNSVTVPDLHELIDIVVSEFRAAPDYDFELFRGTGRRVNNSLFLVPRQELGVPYGRNLRRLRENILMWVTHYSLTGEWLPEVPTRNNPTPFGAR